MASLSRTAADLRDVDVQYVADGDPRPTVRENGDALVDGMSRIVEQDGTDLTGYVWWGGGWGEIWTLSRPSSDGTVGAFAEAVAAITGATGGVADNAGTVGAVAETVAALTANLVDPPATGTLGAVAEAVAALSELAWTPAELDNQIAWYDTTDLEGFADTDPIGSVPDRYGVSDPAGASGVRRPSYNAAAINGLDVAAFGNDDSMLADTTDVGVSPSLPVTVWAVARLDAVPASGDGFVVDLSTSSFAEVAVFADGGTDSWRLFNGTELRGPTTTTGWHIFVAAVAADGTAEFWVDGVQHVGDAGARNPDQITIGSREDETDFWDGDIAEVGLVNDLATVDEVANLHGYLGGKYSLTFDPVVSAHTQPVEFDGSDDITFSIPSSVQDGDLMLITVGTQNVALSSTPPSGWTEELNRDYNSDEYVAVFSRVASSEGSSVTVGVDSDGSSPNFQGHLVVIPGASTVDAVDDDTGSTAPSVAGVDGGVLVNFFASANGDDYTLPAGQQGWTGTVWQNNNSALGYEELSSTGATGTRTSTGGGSVRIAVSIAVS